MDYLFFFIYLALSIVINKPQLLAAFVLLEGACLLPYLDSSPLSVIFMLEFVVYSYVLTSLDSVKTKRGCSTIMLIALWGYLDFIIYGEYSTNGTYKTFYRIHLENIYLCTHFFFVYSFIDVRRINDRLRGFIDSCFRSEGSSFYFIALCYNYTKETIKKH